MKVSVCGWLKTSLWFLSQATIIEWRSGVWFCGPIDVVVTTTWLDHIVVDESILSSWWQLGVGYAVAARLWGRATLCVLELVWKPRNWGVRVFVEIIWHHFGVPVKVLYMRSCWPWSNAIKAVPRSVTGIFFRSSGGNGSWGFENTCPMVYGTIHLSWWWNFFLPLGCFSSARLVEKKANYVIIVNHINKLFKMNVKFKN